MLRPILALLAFFLVSPAQAAESYDNCTGTISSLPTTITTQGTWCLKGHLSTAITSGAAVTVATNNVTINCNDFRIGGLAAGVGTNATGILATDRLNTTVRRCGVRGFQLGIRINGAASAGVVIEHNRIDQNTDAGIVMNGSGNIVRFNQIVDTGGRPNSTQTDGVISSAVQSQITDNSIIGVTVTTLSGNVVGITSAGNANEVARNFITGMLPGNSGLAYGIVTGGATGSSIHRNQLLSAPAVDGIAIASGPASQCGNNSHTGWDSGVTGCTDAGGNFGN
jgi:hypothetical protein